MANTPSSPTLPTTQKQPHSFERIICRCCLAEEDELTSHLPLDVAASTYVPFGNEAPASSGCGESSAATLLDCLNGCARIGATLDDGTMPLHICLDCCQALEACCEFIRCVQNADKILRNKQSSSPPAAILKNGLEMETSVVDAPNVEQIATQKELLPISALSLLDLFDESETQILDFTSEKCRNAGTSVAAENMSKLNSPTNFRQLEIPVLNSSKTENEINFNHNEIEDFLSVKTLSDAKDCEITHTTNDTSQISILETHNFIPTLVKDDSNEHHSQNQSNSKKAEKLKCRDVTESNTAGRDNAKHLAKKYTTIMHKGRSFVVNAALATDLKTFHIQNQHKSKYLCMFCIFMCDTKSTLDQHLAKHLGTACYSCTECSYRCRFNYYLMKHLKRVHSDVPMGMHLQTESQTAGTRFYCGICKRYLSSLTALQKHQHDGEVPFLKCTHCSVQETDGEQLLEHMAREHQVFIDANLIASYLADVIIPPATTTTTASTNLSSSRATKLASSVRLSNSSSPSSKKTTTPPATTCSNDTTYSVKSFLSQFIKFHENDPHPKSDLCQFCGRNFKHRLHLLQHEFYVHAKEHKSAILKHVSAKVGNERQQNNRPLLEHQFKCPDCAHVSKTYDELALHTEQHQSSAANFQCSSCRAVFSYEFELKYHMRTHNGVAREYHVPEPSWKMNVALKTRLQQFKQQKLKNRKQAKHKLIQKRRLSLASVSTGKSEEEGSLNSPSNANSDEDMSSPLSSVMSASVPLEIQDDDDGAVNAMADVMLPQAFPRTSSFLYSFSSLSPTTPDAYSSGMNYKQFNCDSTDETYLNDFDLNFLDSSNDFWLQVSNF